MNGELSTPHAKSQELSQSPATARLTLSTESKRPNLRFFWLVFTALAWGGPIILFIYIPLAFLEKLLPQSTSLTQKISSLRQSVFTGGIEIYLRMQDFYKVRYDLDELRKIELQHDKFLIVSNHRSHLDVFLFISQVKNLQLLAKKSLFKVPILGLMMKLTRQIPAEKHDWKSLEDAKLEIENRLQFNGKVLIFPEFRRCEKGFMDINPYSSLPFQIAKKENIPVLPLVVFGTDRVWPKGTLNLKVTPKSLHVKALSPVYPSDFENIKNLKDKVFELSQNAFRELSREL